MNKRPVNYFPPELRELVEADEYLWRVQTSLARKRTEWSRRGFDDATYVMGSLRSRVIEIRKAYVAEMERLSRDIPIVQSGVGVRYVGYQYLLRVVTRIDIFKAETPAALWRFAGYGLTKNLTPESWLRFTHPGLVAYNSRVRKALGRIMYSLMRASSPYRREYNIYVERQVGNGVVLPQAVNRGKRYIIKLWLKHLWRVWRRLEGLPYDNHHPEDTTRFAADFGWA